MQTIAQAEPPQTPGTWRDRVKDEFQGRVGAAKDRAGEAVKARLEQYQPQIEMLGTTYCVSQRPDLYYGIGAAGLGIGIVGTLLVVFLVRRMGRTTA